VDRRLGLALVAAGVAAVVGVRAWLPEPEPALPPQASTDLRLPPPPPLSSPTVPVQSRAGVLSGLVVYLSAGHGYVIHRLGEGWQRPEVHGVLEDTWTAHLVSHDLVPALERAGAQVLTVRERDPNPQAVVLDFDAAELQRPITTVQPAPRAPGLRPVALLRPDGQARWRLRAPGAGRWQLYASWVAASDRDPRATYTVRHPGGVQRTTVDQRRHGGEWWPLAAVELGAEDEVEVVLAGSGGGTLAAGAVRIGGGTVEVTDPRDGSRIERRAWELAAVHLLPGLGAPGSVWDRPGKGFAGDATARARWAAWSHPAGEEAVYLSIHTDAGGGAGTAAVVRWPCVGGDCPVEVGRSRALADAVREGLVGAVRETVQPRWPDRGTVRDQLAELSDEWNDEIPAVLLEVGFHDRPEEARLLVDSGFRAAVSDGIVAGLARWRLGEGAALPPGPAREVVWEGDRVGWAASEPSGHHGPATGWRVRARLDGRWTVGRWLMRTSWQVPEGAQAVEITGLSRAGLGRARVVERPAELVADAER